MRFSVVLQRNQAIFQLVVEDIHIFRIISFRKRDRRIVDILSFSFEVMKARLLELTSKKFTLKTGVLKMTGLH